MFHVGESSVSAPWLDVSDGRPHRAYLEWQLDRISLTVDNEDGEGRVAEGAPGIVDSERISTMDLFMGEIIVPFNLYSSRSCTIYL